METPIEHAYLSAEDLEYTRYPAINDDEEKPIQNPESEQIIDAREFFESPKEQVIDVLSYLGIDLPEHTQLLLAKLFSEPQSLFLKDLAQIPLPPQAGGLNLFKTLSRLTGKNIQPFGPKEKLAYFLSKDLLPNKNGFALYRAGKFLEHTGRQNLRVAYPGSGQDSTQYLSGIEQSSFSNVDTFGIDAGVDKIGNKKVEKAGKQVEYHYGDFHNVVEKKPELYEKFDTAIIEMQNGAGAITNFSQDITRLLKPEGLLVVTKVVDRQRLDSALQFLYTKDGSPKDPARNFSTEYECVGETGQHIFYRKKHHQQSQNTEQKIAA